MKQLQKIFALTAALAMFANPVFSQSPGCDEDNHCDNGCYNESCCVSDWAAYLPIGAFIIAGGVLIATNRGHGGHGGHGRGGHRDTTTGGVGVHAGGIGGVLTSTSYHASTTSSF